MVHDVVRAAAFFFIHHLELFGHLARALDRVGVGADEGRVERGHIGFEHFRCVALGVNGDEYDAHFVRIRAELVHHDFHFAQRGRANVGTLGVAEKHRADFAFLRRVDLERFAVLRGQRDGGVQIAGGDVGIEVLRRWLASAQYGNQQRGRCGFFE